MTMATVTMTMEEYLQLLNGLSSDAIMGEPGSPGIMSPAAEEKPKKKRKTAYQRRYEKNFKMIENRYKLQSGKWKKNGFKRAVQEAHRLSKK